MPVRNKRIGDAPRYGAVANGIFDMARHSGSDSDSDSETATIEKQRTVLEPPRKWNVIMHNDDVTPFPFVEEVLTVVFGKTKDEASRIALYIHCNGKDIIGTYIKSIAESKVLMTREYAKKRGCNEFKITMEKA